MNLKIPEMYNKVLLKMNPEISKLEIIRVDVIDMVSFSGMNYYQEDIVNRNNRYFVNINVYFVRDSSPVGDFKKYNEILNTCFKYVYHDMDFISFKVDRLIIAPSLTNEERFISLFLEKK
jgi:hypothetical protein